MHGPLRLTAALSMGAHGVLVGRLRSVLSALGVAIGIASVVALLAIGEGARQAVAAQFRTLGANVVTVQSHSPLVRLTASDAASLQKRVPGLVAAMPVVGVSIPVRWRSVASGVGVLGVTAQLLRIRPGTILAGSFITHLENADRLHVAVLGYTAYRELFDTADPIGQDVWLGDAAFRVVGVLRPLGGGGFGTGLVATFGSGSGGSSGSSGSSGSGSGGAGSNGGSGSGSGGSAGGGSGAGSGGSSSGVSSGSGSGSGSGAASGAGSATSASAATGSGSSGGTSASTPQTTVAVGAGIDGDVLVPEASAELLTGTPEVSAIWLKAKARAYVEPVILQAQRILDLLHPAALAATQATAPAGRFAALPPGKFAAGPRPCCLAAGAGGQVVLAQGGGAAAQPAPTAAQPPISVQSIDQLAGQADKANRVLSLMLTAIAAVSLLVGGIGVMNIMLVSVRERTAEIGVRKAVGARRTDVVAQFLAESLMLAAVGGVAGWAGGYGGIAILHRYGVSAVSIPGAFGAALLAAAAMGLVFGTYPAYVAASLDPADALRRQ